MTSLVKQQKGFSVVELMIAMLLSMMLAGAIISVFVNNSYSFNQDENIGRMQDDARHALREIAFDISMAGNYADLHIPASVSYDGSLTIVTDCGPAAAINWAYRATDAVTGESLSLTALDNASDANVIAAHSCFSGGELLDGTDVVSIKRVAGAETTALSANGSYLRTNGTVGVVFHGMAPSAPPVTVPAPRADWELRPRIYYIREFANVANDGIPTLCRKVLRGPGPRMTTECIATGIENLQIEYGIDTTENGQPNVYLSNPTLTQMQDVVAARIFLVARTTEVDPRYQNTKTYSVSNAPNLTPNDNFHRRVFSTSVSIQNIRTMNMMGF